MKLNNREVTIMEVRTLPAGSMFYLAGIPLRLEQDTAVSTTEGNWKLIDEAEDILGL